MAIEKSYLGLLVLLLGCLGSLQGRHEGVAPLKKYTINLDLPPEDRWTVLVKENKHLIEEIHILFNAYLPKALYPIIEKIASKLDKYLPNPYRDEIRGIAAALNSSVGNIVMANLVYDVSAYCTSIVSQDAQGRIWHSRNFDYNFVDSLKDLAVMLDFTRGGKVMYSTVGFAGFVGIVTGQKPNVFTVTVDQRNVGTIIDLFKNILVAILDRNALPTTFLLRDTFEEASNFSTAVTRLSNTSTYAPVYFIVGGVHPGEGTVITRNRLSSDVWTIDSSTGRWFEVETNYDHWLKPPTHDDRRDPAIKLMKALGQKNINVQTLYKVMSTAPVLNRNTLYSIVMSASQPHLMQVWMRV